VAVEVLESPVVDGRGSGVGVTGCELDISQRNAGVEGSHDESGSKHVRVHIAEPGTLPDRADPPVRRAPLEALAVPPPQDRVDPIEDLSGFAVSWTSACRYGPPHAKG
jgi:hypothetical protein